MFCAVGTDGKLGTKRTVPCDSASGMPYDTRFSADSSEAWVTDSRAAGQGCARAARPRSASTSQGTAA